MSKRVKMARVAEIYRMDDMAIVARVPKNSGMTEFARLEFGGMDQECQSG